jgi:hypothetical protein
MRRLAMMLVGVLMCACHTAPPTAAPRPATEIRASFGKTWDATIDVFGDRDLNIRTIDRSSGLIVPGDFLFTSVKPDSALRYANCGKFLGNPIVPTIVHFNVVVRGDSSASTVLVRAFYDHSKPMNQSGDLARQAGNCTSTGLFESDLEGKIATRAEKRR